MFKFKQDHPYRPVNWRWERARILKEHGKATPGRHKDDRWVKLATSFRIAKDNCENEIDLYRIFDKWPELATAYELWDEENSNNGRPNAMRYEIEARLLSGESFKDIADRCGLPEVTIEFYEKLFFNVTDRLKNKMYVFHIAIGDQLHRGMTDRDYGILWKIYGYVRGPEMLDFLIGTFSDWSRPVGLMQAEQQLTEDHKSTMRRKAALASRMTGINQHTADRLIELHTKIMEVENSAGSGSPEGVQQNIQVMLNHLPLLVGSKVDNIANDPIKNYKHLSADLRASELMALSAGQDIIEVEKLSEFSFPKPETNSEDTK